MILILCRLVICGLLLLGSTACGGESAGDGRMTVVASFHPLAEAAARVGGDAVDVVNLTPAGVEPHDVELTSRQVDDVLDADVVLYVGGGFQPAVEDAVDRRDDDGGAVDLLARLDLDAGEDPHFWVDPVLMAEAAELIAEAVDGDAQAYRRELLDLHADFQQGLADCERRVMVTSHAAFHYLARRYGLTEEPLAGLSPEAEPDPRRLGEVADFVDEHGITTVFTEPLLPARVADALAREAGVEVATLDPLEGLTERQVDAGETYTSVMRDNLAALRRALGCR